MDFLSSLDTSFLVDSLSESILISDAEGNIIFYNKAFEDLFGYDSDELVGHNITVLMSPPDASHHNAYIHNYRDTIISKTIGSTLPRPLTGKRKDQRLFPIDIKISEFRKDNKLYFIAIMTDLSDATDSENRLEHILDQTDIILYTMEVSEQYLRYR